MINAILKRAYKNGPLHVFLLVLLLSFQSSTVVFSQTPAAVANFSYPVLDLSTTPAVPGLCGTDGVKVKCNKEYKTYTWRHKNGTVLTGQEVTITLVGDWELTVLYEDAKVSCERISVFKVYDLSSTTETEQFLQQNQFFDVNIELGEPLTLRDHDVHDNRMQTCTVNALRFVGSNAQDFIDYRLAIASVTSDFEPASQITNNSVFIKNDCICDIGIENIVTDALGIYSIEWLPDASSSFGKLYTRVNIEPGKSQPVGDHKDYMRKVYPAILDANESSTYITAEVLIKDLVMGTVVETFTDEPYVCGLDQSLLNNRFVFTSAGVPIKLPVGATNVVFTNGEYNSGVFSGSLNAFTAKCYTKDNKKLIDGHFLSHYWPGDIETNAGYYCYINAEMFRFCKPFVTPSSPSNIPYVIPVPSGDNKCILNVVSGSTDLNNASHINYTDGGYKLPIVKNVNQIGNFPTTAIFDVDKEDFCLEPLNPSEVSALEYAYNSIGKYAIYVERVGSTPTNYYACKTVKNGINYKNLLFKWENNCWKPIEANSLAQADNLARLTVVGDVLLEAGNVAGYLPIIGAPGNFLAGVIYAVRGDLSNAAISMAAVAFETAIVKAAPSIVWGVKKFKYRVTAKLFNESNVIFDDGLRMAYQAPDGLIKEFPIQEIAEQLDNIAQATNKTLAEVSSKLMDDLGKEGLELVDYMAKNPLKGMGAWDGLINIPTIRTKVIWLTRSSKWIDEGGELVTTNGVTKLRKGADDILEIKNDKILPNKYDFDPATQKPNPNGTPVGEPSDGYQVYKNGNDLSVRRVPETGGYDTQDLAQLTGSNAHPNCHVLERHGHDVTDEALIKRANFGTAPDGNPGGKPPHSSKFDSPEKVAEGLNNTKQGTPAWAAGIQGGKFRKVYYTSSNFVGKGVPKDVSNFVSTKKIFALYEDLGGGNYKLLTMYPEF